MGVLSSSKYASRTLKSASFGGEDQEYDDEEEDEYYSEEQVTRNAKNGVSPASYQDS